MSRSFRRVQNCLATFGGSSKRLERTAQAVNTGLGQMYWQIGSRMHWDVLGNKRAGYGREIVQTLSAQLTQEYGKGFKEESLRRMLQFVEVFTDE